MGTKGILAAKILICIFTKIIQMFPEQDYQLVFECDQINLYVPTNTTTYHTSRLVEATRMNMYAASGATEEAIQQHLDAIIELCNQKGDIKTIRTDIGSIATALKARTKYPIDTHVAIRLGAILSFGALKKDGKEVTFEDPNKAEIFWLNKKIELAMEQPDLYTFFLSTGISSIPQYNNLLDTLNDMDYFVNRMKTLMGILPETHSRLSRI